MAHSQLPNFLRRRRRSLHIFSALAGCQRCLGALTIAAPGRSRCTESLKIETLRRESNAARYVQTPSLATVASVQPGFSFFQREGVLVAGDI